jgi:hypothetical protein
MLNFLAWSSKQAERVFAFVCSGMRPQIKESFAPRQKQNSQHSCFPLLANSTGQEAEPFRTVAEQRGGAVEWVRERRRRQRRRRCIFRAETPRFIIHAKTLKLQFISRRSLSLARSLRAPPLCIVISSSIKNREVALPDPTAPRPPLCSLRVISSLSLSLSLCLSPWIYHVPHLAASCKRWWTKLYVRLPLTFVHVYTQTVSRTCTHHAHLVCTRAANL